MKQVPVAYHFMLLWVCSLLPLAAAATVADGDINTDGCPGPRRAIAV